MQKIESESMESGWRRDPSGMTSRGCTITRGMEFAVVRAIYDGTKDHKYPAYAYLCTVIREAGFPRSDSGRAIDAILKRYRKRGDIVPTRVNGMAVWAYSQKHWMGLVGPFITEKSEGVENAC